MDSCWMVLAMLANSLHSKVVILRVRGVHHVQALLQLEAQKGAYFAITCLPKIRMAYHAYVMNERICANVLM